MSGIRSTNGQLRHSDGQLRHSDGELRRQMAGLMGYTKRELGRYGLRVETVSLWELAGREEYGENWGQIPGPEAGGFMNFDHYMAWRYQSEYRGTLKNIEYRKTLVGGRKPAGVWPGKTSNMKGGDGIGRAEEISVEDGSEEDSGVRRV